MTDHHLKPQIGGGHWLASLVQKTWYSPLPSSPLKPMLPILHLGAKIYEAGLRSDQQRQVRRLRTLPAPVVSIGNITTGGTGKTPLTIWLARQFAAIGGNPAVLTRGYGRKGREMSRVPPGGDPSSGALDFGDEPTLMAGILKGLATVWVGRDRWSSGQEAIRSGANILLLDDGFQHLRLHRDLDLVLLDACNPFGNGELLPLGPLREPVSSLKRADAVILTRADNPTAAALTASCLKSLFPEKPLFSCRHKPVGPRLGLGGPLLPLSSLQEHRLVAFAGIGKPDSFFASLGQMGLCTDACIAYPDHYRYRQEDMARLRGVGGVKGKPSLLITTEKDFVRLPADYRRIVLTVGLEMDFGPDQAAFCMFLGNILDRQGDRSGKQIRAKAVTSCQPGTSPSPRRTTHP